MEVAREQARGSLACLLAPAHRRVPRAPASLQPSYSLFASEQDWLVIITPPAYYYPLVRPPLILPIFLTLRLTHELTISRIVGNIIDGLFASSLSPIAELFTRFLAFSENSLRRPHTFTPSVTK
jgi:hypothetical protein